MNTRRGRRLTRNKLPVLNKRIKKWDKRRFINKSNVLIPTNCIYCQSDEGKLHVHTGFKNGYFNVKDSYICDKCLYLCEDCNF